MFVLISSISQLLLPTNYCSWMIDHLFLIYQLQLPPEWTEQFDSGIQVSLNSLLISLHSFSSINAKFVFDFDLPDYCCYSGWAWPTSAWFLQDCEFLIEPFLDRVGSDWVCVWVLFCWFECLDTRRPSFCAENEAHFRVIRVSVRILSITAVFFHSECFVFIHSSSKAAGNADPAAPSPVQLGVKATPYNPFNAGVAS